MNRQKILQFKHKRIIFSAIFILVSFCLSLTTLFDGDWVIVKRNNAEYHKGICCSDYGRVIFEHLITTDLYLECVFELLSIYRLVIIWFQVARDKFEKNLFISFLLLLGSSIIFNTINLIVYPICIKSYPQYYDEPKLSVCYWIMIPTIILHVISLVLLCLAYYSFHNKRSFENLSFKNLLFCL